MIVNKNTKIYVGDTPIIGAYQGDNQIYRPYTELEYFIVNDNAHFFVPCLFNDSYHIIFKAKVNNVNCNLIHPQPEGQTLDYLWDYWGRMFKWYYWKRGVPLSYSVSSVPVNIIIESKQVGNRQYGCYKDFQGNILHDGWTTARNLTGYTSIQLFGWGGGYGMSGNFYYFKIYDQNEQLIYDFVPAIDAKGVVCIYDKINKVFVYSEVDEPTAGPIKQ